MRSKYSRKPSQVCTKGARPLKGNDDTVFMREQSKAVSLPCW